MLIHPFSFAGQIEWIEEVTQAMFFRGATVFYKSVGVFPFWGGEVGGWGG